jgi:hypothetical protein
VAKWRVTAQVTISILTDVDAPSEAEALDIAADLPMQSLCNACASGDPDGQWVTSGELDGTPDKVRARPSVK